MMPQRNQPRVLEKRRRWEQSCSVVDGVNEVAGAYRATGPAFFVSDSVLVYFLFLIHCICEQRGGLQHVRCA